MKKQKLRRISIFFPAVLTVLVLAVVILTGAARVNASEVRSGREAYVSVRIEDGDSLWSISERYRTPDYAGTMDYMKKVASLNHLATDATIHTGGYLLVPVIVEE